MEPELRTWAEISLLILRSNFASIQQAVGNSVTLAPVVKADAYGHGAVQVSRTLELAGAGWLAVSCVQEGVILRESGIGARILVMGGILAFEREPAYRHGLTPVVHSLEELEELDRASLSLAVHLKVDTGMSRLGTMARPAEVVQALGGLRSVRVEGLMSHFASAEDFSSGQTEEQTALFDEVCKAVREAGLSPGMLHFCSSSGIAYGRTSARHSLVRPGLAIYGYIPAPAGAAPAPLFQVQPVLRWYARLLNVREIAAGTPVGYMARFRAPRAMRIGTVAAGYADGIPHRLSTRGSFIAGGCAAPILGAVSMDLTTIDLTAAPQLQPGDAVTILGEGMDAQQIAGIAGEIPYSVLCGIGNRVRRIYSEA